MASKYGIEHRRKCLIQPITDVRSTGRRFAQPIARRIAQARTTAGSTTVDAEKKHVTRHFEALITGSERS